MARDPASSPSVEEALRAAAARFALLADVLELQALGIERADQPVGPEGSRALAETCQQAVGDLEQTPERTPRGAAQLVRRGHAEEGPAPMSLMRTYRRALRLSQSAFAAQLNVPRETYRPWDAGRREPPAHLLTRARTLAGYPDETVLLPLPVLASMIGVHVRTLHAAARSGRLVVAYDTRTTFRRLRPRAT